MSDREQEMEKALRELLESVDALLEEADAMSGSTIYVYEPEFTAVLNVMWKHGYAQVWKEIPPGEIRFTSHRPDIEGIPKWQNVKNLDELKGEPHVKHFLNQGYQLMSNNQGVLMAVRAEDRCVIGTLAGSDESLASLGLEAWQGGDEA